MSGDFDEMFQQKPAGNWSQRFDKERPNAPDGEETAGSGPYKPYGYTPAHDLDSCDIAWWLTGSVPQGQEVQYRFMIRVGYVADEQISLMLTDCIITIEGRNLRDLRKRLARGRVTFIQAFNPLIWPRPADGDAVVDKIAILYPGEAAATLQRQ